MIIHLCFQQKQRCPALEELLVDLIVVAMERSEDNEASISETGCQLLWHHLSSHLIFFVLFQFASFPHMVLSLYTKVSNVWFQKYIHTSPKDGSLVWTLPAYPHPGISSLGSYLSFNNFGYWVSLSHQNFHWTFLG